MITTLSPRFRRSRSNESENRIYRLEGYLFPDTYEFYTDSSAKSVITKFLDNFDYRIDTTVRSSIKASGREVSLDQIITLASIIQAEAAGDSDMPGISRVLWNRLDNPDQFPRLGATPHGIISTILFPSRKP